MPNSNEYMREYMKNRRKTRRDKLIAMSGNKCAHCDETENLEFNHLDRTTKLFTLSGDALDKSWETILAEKDKCELICPDHHLEYTRQQYEAGEILPWNKNLHGPYIHGTARAYTKLNCRCVDCKSAKRLYRVKQITYFEVIPG